MAVVLGVLASIAYGCADFLGGLYTRRAQVLTVVFVSQLAGTTLLVVTLPFFLGEGLSLAAASWGAAAGVAGAAGVTMLFRGLGRAPMSVVAPITGTVAASLPVVVGLLSGERPSPLALAGVGLALAAVALVSSAGEGSATDENALPGRDRRLGIPDALGAGASFGLFFILLDRAPDGSGLWPLLAGRISSLVVIALAALLTKTALRPPPRSLLGISASGIFDVAANLFFLLAARRGYLALVAVLTSMYPGTTVVLARVVLRERLTRAQLVGLALAAGGIIAMAAG